MRLYVAGPMRGCPEFNFPAFANATAKLRDSGHEVLSPGEETTNKGFKWVGTNGDLAEMDSAGVNSNEELANDLVFICNEADAVIVLPDWHKSRGACAEVATARALSIPVFELDLFLQLAADAPQVIEAYSPASIGSAPVPAEPADFPPPERFPEHAPDEPTHFVTRDSGARVDYESGMRRDVQDGKARFDLCLPERIPYDDQMLTRWAALMERGAVKYGERNWELATGEDEMERFKGSALRHLMQWLLGDAPEEDHAAAVFFNITAAETLKCKMREKL